MKKITFWLIFLIACTSVNYAQCIQTTPNPVESIASNNSGDPQQINSCVYTGHFSTVSNINVGQEYTLSLASNGTPVSKYITVTDVNNSPIAFGPTPLTVNGITTTSIRVHYSEDENCGTEEWCLESYIKVTLSCPFPTAIQISGVTTTHASFAWTAGNAESAWQVLVLPKGSNAPTSSTSGTPVTGAPEYTVDTLEAAHQYEFYVRADCGSEYSPWRGPFNFNGGCDPIAVFNENFDSTENGELPSCWTALFVNASPNASITINGLSNSAPNAVQLANDNSAAEANILLISPNLSTLSTASHRLKFYTRGYGNVSVQVGTINATTADGTFNSIETINATANYTEHVVDFTGYTGTDTYIAFRHANTNTYNPVFLDDIRWEAAPLCPDVKDIQVTNLTQTSATIGWQPGGSEPQWDVVYSETANDPATLTPITPAPTDPEALISGLQANTTYKVWVRSSCDESLGDGAWMNPITFTTPCNATNVLNETFENAANGSLPECWSAILTGSSIFNNSIRVVSNNAASGTKAVSLFNGEGTSDSSIILVLPSLNTVTTGTHRLKFYARGNSATIQIGTLDSPANGATFTSYQPLNITAAYTEYLVDFTGYTGPNTYIGIKLTSGQYSTAYLDNIRWEVAPLCADVTNITAAGITAASAFLDWTANAGETQWDVVYGTETVTNPDTLTSISPAPSTDSETLLSGLTDNTVYKVWVRSACGGTQGNGAWIGPISFRTACLPTGQFNEGFETAENGNLPDCWSAVLAGPTIAQYAAVRTVSNDAAFGNNAVELHANSSAPTDFIMLVSPYLNTLSAGTHRLKFYALSYNTETPLQIGTLNGNTSQAIYTTYQSITLGTGYNEYVVDFTNYSGTDTYIAFRNVAGNYNSTFIDYVRWEVIPSCADVATIGVSEIQAGTATATWSAGGSETNWQVVYGLSSVSDPSTLTPSEILTNTSFGLSGLEDNTFYNVWVRSVCGGTDGNGAWIGPIVFKTKCSPTTAPYVQDFESTTLPNLPDCSILENNGAGANWDTTYGDSGYGFDGYVLRYNGNASEASAWYFTQGIQLTGGAEYAISYTYGNNSSDNYVESLQVLYGPAANANSMTEEIADHPQINTGMATTNVVTFVPAQTAVYYFGFQAYSDANQSQLFLDDITVSATLSNPEANSTNFTYYPNPVKDVLHLSSASPIANVTVINLLGQKVLESNPNEAVLHLNLSGLPTGSYIVKVTADNATKTIKVLKQ